MSDEPEPYRPRFFILDNDGATPMPCTMEEWSEWRWNNDNHLAVTTVADVFVSTIFLGVDRSMYCGWPMRLWETAIFRSGKSADVREHETREEALAYHAATVAKLQVGANPHER